MRKVLDFTWRAAILAVVFAAVQAVVAGVVFRGSDLAKAMGPKDEVVSAEKGAQSAAAKPGQTTKAPSKGRKVDPAQAKAAGTFLLVAVIEAVVVSFFVRSLSGPWHLKMILGILAYFGLDTFMSQIETAYYWNAFSSLSSADLVRFFVRGIIVALIFVPAAILVHWRRKKTAGWVPPVVDLSGSAWKVPVMGAIYTFIYFMFGYFVAWQFAEVRRFYSGSTDLLAFAPHFASAFSDRPSYIPFQFARGLMWTGFGLCALGLMKGTRMAVIAAITAMFAVLPSIQLAYPNPFMPAPVRFAHFVETASSLALFGAVLGLLFTRRASPAPARRGGNRKR